MKISMNLSEKSIDDAIRKLEKYQKDLERKSQLLKERLASLGKPILSLNKYFMNSKSVVKESWCKGKAKT